MPRKTDILATSAPPPTTTRRARAVLGQLSDMDLRLLQIFKSVVECGGMSAAELELNVGTSTLSRHMKDLETRLGMVLCRRGRAGFSLTPEGHQVYEATLQLLGGVDLFRSRIDDIHAVAGSDEVVARAAVDRVVAAAGLDVLDGDQGRAVGTVTDPQRPRAEVGANGRRA